MMLEGGRKERRWLRPLGLFLLVMALAVGHPFALIGVPLLLLSLLMPEVGKRSLILGAFLIVFLLPGGPDAGLWYLERGWALLVGGWFLVLTRTRPDRPFLEQGLLALGGGTVWAALLMVAFGAWERTQTLVEERLSRGAEATMDLFGSISEGQDGEMTSAFAEAVVRTSEIQGVIFPALLALATLAALGVAWWLHVRISTGSDAALGPLRSVNFPDPLIWVLIGGLILLLVAGWDEGFGRVGTNLTVFMAGLYVLRGAGVVLALSGGLSIPALILVGVAAVLAPPLLLFGAMAVGIGDSWFDLRSRQVPPGNPGAS
jgi:hypothetical protein